MTAEAGAGWKPRYNPWLIAVVATLAAFMEILDTTIVNVALPHIAGAMSASNDEATWTLTSYLVANGIVLTISGWLSDLLGRKRYFLICIAMFTVCSFLCGIAGSLVQLVVFRLAQGFFGGGLQPNQQSIILDSFPPAKRGAAFGVAAIAIVVAPVLGPTLGGFITDNSSWRWIFFINIPVGIFAVFANWVLVEDPPWEQNKPSRGIDYIGLSLITIGLGCLQIMMDRGEDDDWFGSPFIVTLAFLFILRGLTLVGLKFATGGSTQLRGVDEVVQEGVVKSLFSGVAFQGFFSWLASQGLIEKFDTGLPKVSGVPVSIIWFIGFAIVATWVLLRTRVGNWIYAAGGDSNAARNSGLLERALASPIHYCLSGRIAEPLLEAGAKTIRTALRPEEAVLIELCG